MAFIYPAWILKLRRKVLNFFNRYSVPRWLVFTADLTLVFLAFLVAYLLRFNFSIPGEWLDIFIWQGLIATSVYALFSLAFRSYCGLLRHATLTDITLVFVVTTCSAIVLVLFSLFGNWLQWADILAIPQSIILIHYVTVSIILFAGRIFIKMIFRFATGTSMSKKNVLVYGAGELGFVVKRVILSDPRYGFHVSGFIDDDKSKQGKKINGILVYGTSALSAKFIEKNNIESLIFAIKALDVDKKSSVIRKAVNLGLEVLDTPEVDKWVAGQLRMPQFRRVDLEDLLGREPIKLNINLIKKGLAEKTIMITGAAGSIGSEIARQLTSFHCEKVILVDQAETPLFFLQGELREKFLDIRFSIIPADVTNIARMEQIFDEYRPHIVFHAAAYKHVSLMEENPHEAIRVNVGGTRIVTDLAVKYGVEKFVMISTDKSVNPSSVMGASKRLCEKVVQSRAQEGGHSTQFIITRFGNVIGSNGSVIPIFARQIENGGPVTVTHPEVYRYFMTIPEACQLVLEAGFMGQGGEIFVFDMGQQVKIADLAKAMIKLSGFIPDKDIQIVYTGLRPGEKLYEELLTDAEMTTSTHHEKIKKALVENIDGKEFLERIDWLLKELYSLCSCEVVQVMKDLIPEYHTTNGKFKLKQKAV
ncbi:MAG TPA: nucleoside-diphosphate sugar epimerase/dehydratase [Spirochaetota bacterium]|jgi:FlaA1/EpsC-like NDP-sugar epimerase|nr:nucleoside-diphosphate sugar epimerase/dehydratase [Spirochaetota bacterium]